MGSRVSSVFFSHPIAFYSLPGILQAVLCDLTYFLLLFLPYLSSCLHNAMIVSRDIVDHSGPFEM